MESMQLAHALLQASQSYMHALQTHLSSRRHTACTALKYQTATLEYWVGAPSVTPTAAAMYLKTNTAPEVFGQGSILGVAFQQQPSGIGRSNLTDVKAGVQAFADSICRNHGMLLAHKVTEFILHWLYPSQAASN